MWNIKIQYENKAEKDKQGFLNRWTFNYDLKEMQLLFIVKKHFNF